MYIFIRFISVGIRSGFRFGNIFLMPHSICQMIGVVETGGGQRQEPVEVRNWKKEQAYVSLPFGQDQV